MGSNFAKIMIAFQNKSVSLDVQVYSQQARGRGGAGFGTINYKRMQWEITVALDRQESGNETV